MSEPVARVRGVYATGVTALLREHDVHVVDPSPIVGDRLEDSGENALQTVTIASTEDRLGIELDGESGDVNELVSLLAGLSSDTFWWSSRLPIGAVRAGRIERTEESGAIVAIGEMTAFLPYSKSTEYVSQGDRLAIQVIDPEPPWSVDRRPVVSAIPHVPGTYLDLIADPDRQAIDAPDRELYGLVELLDPDLPTEWSVVVSRTASAVDLDIIEAELARLRKRRESVEAAMETAADPDEPGGVYAPETTVWCRFGRQGRFELDEYRSAVTETISGHHRLKAGGTAAARAVDYLECLDIEAPFQPDAVIDGFGPHRDDRIRIDHGKPTGETIVLGRGTVVDRPKPDAITVRRELSPGGSLDGLDVPKEAGDIAETTFVEGNRWAPTIYRDTDGERKGTYVNVSTPIELFPDRVSYVDLYVDIIKDADGGVTIVDQDDLADAVDNGTLSADVAEKATQVAASIRQSLAGE